MDYRLENLYLILRDARIGKCHVCQKKLRYLRVWNDFQHAVYTGKVHVEAFLNKQGISLDQLLTLMELPLRITSDAAGIEHDSWWCSHSRRGNLPQYPPLNTTSATLCWLLAHGRLGCGASVPCLRVLEDLHCSIAEGQVAVTSVLLEDGISQAELLMASGLIISLAAKTADINYDLRL